MTAAAASGTRRRNKNRKVLLMGKSGAGKSSMRSIVFSNYVAKDVRRLGATIGVEHSNIRFMGNLMLNLWDCGGQDPFMESYLASQHDRNFHGGIGGTSSGDGQRERMFSNVAVLIYVFDVESRDYQADVATYTNMLRALSDHSPTAQVFVLVHKMDLVEARRRDQIFDERRAYIRAHSDVFAPSVTFHATSIWDQSLYRAWTAVIYTLVPNASAIEALLSRLAAALDARELILYERTTCLTVMSVTRGVEAQNPFHDRLERLSAILKAHKHSLARHARLPAASAQFASLEIKTSRFMLFACRMTENTNLAAVLPPSEMGFNAARLNIAMARSRFVELDVAVPQAAKVRVDPETFMSGAARDVRPLAAVDGAMADEGVDSGKRAKRYGHDGADDDDD